MGSEILIVFVPVPFMIWLWNIKQILFNQARELSIFALLFGLSLSLFVVLPFQTSEKLVKDLTLIGVLYIPFYLVLLFALTKFLTFKKRRVRMKSD